jgi:hypothetical protein
MTRYFSFRDFDWLLLSFVPLNMPVPIASSCSPGENVVAFTGAEVTGWGRGRPWRGRRECSTASCSSCAPAPSGLTAVLPTRHAIAAFQQWVRSGVMRGVLEALAEDLRL